MAEFSILDHLEKLKPDGGSAPRGEQSFHCPACDAENFKVHLTNGKWNTFSCDCAATESGKRRIRAAIEPPVNPNPKPIRPKSERVWTYTDSNGTPVLEVHRTDDGNGERKIWQRSLIAGKRPAEAALSVVPYGLLDALQALADGAPHVFWVEGEPCVDALRKLGLYAVTNLRGCDGFIPDRDAGLIPADRLVVIPDRDKPGLKHAQRVANAHPGCQWLYPFPGTPQWNGSCPPNGGLDIADWIAQGATVDQILDGIGEQLKPGAEPSGEAQGAGFIADVIKDAEGLRKTLDDGLTAIDALPDVAMRSVALVQLQRSIGLPDKQFMALIHQLAEHREEAPPDDFAALLAYADNIATEPIIEDLLGVGLTLLAADGGTGKSSKAYEIVEAVTTGGKFAGQFQAQQHPCLVVQLDESPKDASVKWRRMGFAPDASRIHFMWKFNPMMFPELRAKVKATGAKVVVLDSLLKVAGGVIKAVDAEFGLLIYRLNQLASELGIAIICIHHLSKGEKGKQRASVTKEDIYGSAYVFNGSADVWGYWSFREDGNPEPMFGLQILKNRSSIVELNTIYEFEGSHEDHRLQFRGIRDRVISLDEIKTHRERVRQFLASRPGTVFTVKQVNDATQIGSQAYCKRLLSELYQARVGVDRKQLPSTGGRPPYGYFGVETPDQPRARVSASCKEVSPPSLPLASEKEEGGSKGVTKAPKAGDFLSLEPPSPPPETSNHLPHGYLDDLDF